MWFYPILGILVLLGLAGGVFMGGVFTLVLVPLVIIALASAAAYAFWARSQTQPTGADGVQTAGHAPLPHSHDRPPTHASGTPEQLVDGRRGQSQIADS